MLRLARSARLEPVRALRRSAGRAAAAVRAVVGAVPHCRATEPHGRGCRSCRARRGSNVISVMSIAETVSSPARNMRCPTPRTSACDLDPVRCLAKAEFVGEARIVVAIEHRQINLPVRAAAHRHVDTAPVKIPSSFWLVKVNRLDPLGGDPEILAGCGQHFEIPGRRSSASRKSSNALPSMEPVTRGRRVSAFAANAPASAVSPRGARWWPAVSPPARRSARPEIPAGVRRAAVAAAPFRHAPTGGTPRRQPPPVDPRCCRVQDDVGAFQIAGEQQQFRQQHARRRDRRAPCAPLRWRRPTASARLPARNRAPAVCWSAGSRLSLMALAPGPVFPIRRGSSALPRRRDFGHQAERSRHVVELEMRLQMDRAAKDARPAGRSGTATRPAING